MRSEAHESNPVYLMLDDLKPGVLYTGISMYNEKIVFTPYPLLGKDAYVLLAIEADGLETVIIFYPAQDDPEDYQYIRSITDIREYTGTVTLRNEE